MSTISPIIIDQQGLLMKNESPVEYASCVSRPSVKLRDARRIRHLLIHKYIPLKISEDMKMYPCSFMVNTEQFGDLRKERMVDIWQSHPAFVKHREAIRHNSCNGCIHQAVCRGGCVFLPEINHCGVEIT